MFSEFKIKCTPKDAMKCYDQNILQYTPEMLNENFHNCHR